MMEAKLSERLREAHKWATAENDHFEPELGLEAAQVIEMLDERCAQYERAWNAAVNNIDRITAERDALQMEAQACMGLLEDVPGASFGDRVEKLVTEFIALRKALEFYADPFEWKKENDPNNDVQVPDFYIETSFGDTAIVALATYRVSDADGPPPSPRESSSDAGGPL